jgi:hypothetical protein
MKAIGLLLIALFVQGCFFHPYFNDKESDWWYLEDWDINKDMVIDKDEFTTSFEKYEMIRKISANAQPVGYAVFDSLVVRLTRNTGEHQENKPTAASFDTNGDQKLSEPELAAGMFVIADDNRDNKVSGLEFYEWEVYL